MSEEKNPHSAIPAAVEGQAEIPIQVQLLEGALDATCEAEPTGGPCAKCGHASILHTFKKLLALRASASPASAEIARLQAELDKWKEIARLRDEDTAQQIRLLTAAEARVAALADEIRQLKKGSK